MNQYPSHKIDDFECTGPRPPVPGEESRRQKVILLLFFKQIVVIRSVIIHENWKLSSKVA